MRITRALVPAAVVALAFAAGASGGRPGLTVHGWAVPAHTAATTAPAGTVVPLRLLPITRSYGWSQPAFVGLTTSVPLTLAQLPLLTTYHWAQPGTTAPRTRSVEPWSL